MIGDTQGGGPEVGEGPMEELLGTEHGNTKHLPREGSCPHGRQTDRYDRKDLMLI